MDRSSQSATWCRILPESTVHTYDHTSCPMLSDLYTICDRIFGEGSAESAKVQLDWKCFFKAVLQRQQMDKCSEYGSGGMVQNLCQALSFSAGISRHAGFCLLL